MTKGGPAARATAPGTLRLVGTPIGNRGDLAPRAREVLARVSVVACEDTRTCRSLYSWMGVPVPELVAYHDHSAEGVADRLVSRVTGGEDVAVVSEAGMPAIQDPGFTLVAAARGAGLPVVPVPGPSAVLLALAASGLPTDRFTFLGFAPRRGRANWWGDALARAETLVVFEAPGRVAATTAAIAELEPERPTCLARELTKVHEEFVTGTAREVSEQLAARAERLRGECVLVVAGSPGPAATPARAWPDALRALRGESVAADLSPRVLVDLLACVYPGQRNAIYRAVHAEGEEPT